jgi:hypothetical protein
MSLKFFSTVVSIAVGHSDTDGILFYKISSVMHTLLKYCKLTLCSTEYIYYIQQPLSFETLQLGRSHVAVYVPRKDDATLPWQTCYWAWFSLCSECRLKICSALLLSKITSNLSKQPYHVSRAFWDSGIDYASIVVIKITCSSLTKWRILFINIHERRLTKIPLQQHLWSCNRMLGATERSVHGTSM